MNWLKQWIFPSETKLATLAQKLADGCQEQVWRRVSEKSLAMTLPEARGYVRARAAVVVKRAVDATIARTASLATAREQLQELATEQVIRLISAQLRAVRPAQRLVRRAA